MAINLPYFHMKYLLLLDDVRCSKKRNSTTPSTVKFACNSNFSLLFTPFLARNYTKFSDSDIQTLEHMALGKFHSKFRPNFTMPLPEKMERSLTLHFCRVVLLTNETEIRDKTRHSGCDRGSIDLASATIDNTSDLLIGYDLSAAICKF